MSPPSDPGPLRRGLGPGMILLAVAALAVAYESRWPTLPALLFAALGVAASGGMRIVRPSLLAGVAPIPALLVLGVLATETPIAPVPELLVGAAGVAFVLWLLDDPFRPPAGISRGTVVWGVPALAVGIAWASAFLLPSSAATLGVAGGLVAAALIVFAFLVGRPDLFDRDEASTI
ncbi:MAG: hypothetical protein WA547_06590 [Thermoplasmata archaeon]